MSEDTFIDLSGEDMASQITAADFKNIVSSSISYTQPETPVSVKKELARREQIKNEDLKQDIKLRRFTLRILLTFLGVETFFIFLFSFMQATESLNFDLEEWSFRLLVGATITQIYLMLRIAVEYLFPKFRD